MSTTEVSIVVPTFHRPDGLRACLEGITQLRFDMRRAEIIVVDDGGVPGVVAAVAKEFRDRLAVRTIHKSNGGPASARNAGAAEANGRFLVFIDDDCVPHRSWLSSLVQTLEKSPAALTGGPVLNGLPDNRYADASQRIATCVATHYAEGRGAERFFTTNNFALSAERFRELRGFDESIAAWTAEDKEFCDRWRDCGYPMVWTSDARVDHSHPLTLGRFLRQHFDYGRGILSFRRKRVRRSGKRLVPEPPGFYLTLVLHPLREELSFRALRTVSLLVVSQVATIVGAIVCAFAEPRRREPAVPAVAGETSLGEGE